MATKMVRVKPHPWRSGTHPGYSRPVRKRGKYTKLYTAKMRYQPRQAIRDPLTGEIRGYKL